MVKKLFKHEINSYTKYMGLVSLILLSVSLFCRVIQFFDNDSVVYNIVFGSSILAVVVAVFAAMILTTLLIVVRFYKNMFTAEGYLTLTLPITTAQHIFVKVVCAMIFDFTTLLSIVISLIVTTAGDVCVEIFKAGGYLVDLFFKEFGFNAGLYIVEFAILMLVSSATGILLYYACLSIGQLAKKAKIIFAIGVYYLYYIVSQIFGTILTITFEVFSTFYEEIGEFIISHQTSSLHIILIVGIVITVLQGIVYYFVTHFIMKKKLNLE